jgi:FG-GAP-like repeat
MDKRRSLNAASIVLLAISSALAFNIDAHAGTQPTVDPSAASLSPQREAAIAALRERLRHRPHSSSPILFSEPPTVDSLPPDANHPPLPDSLTVGMVSFAVGDLDGDHLADFVGVENADSVLVVRRNLGGGIYALGVHYPLAPGATFLVLADFNGDGHLDVGVANLAPLTGPPPLARAYSTLRNRGDGTFEPRIDGALSFLPVEVHAADIGHDGRADLVFTLFNHSSVDIVRSRADGSFAPAFNLSASTQAYNYSNTAADVGDLDGDGNPDIVMLYNDGDCNSTFGVEGSCLKLAVFYGRADGTFEDPLDYQAYDPDSPRNAQSVTIRPVDGDQRPDIVVRIGGPGPPAAPAVIHNQGARRLDAPFVQELSLAPVALAAGHFHHAGAEDLVFSDAKSVSILRGRGDGTFKAIDRVANGALGAVVDLNGDGLGDLIVTRNDTTEIWISDGSGGFQSPVSLTAGRFRGVANFIGDHHAHWRESERGHQDRDAREPLDIAVWMPNGHIGIVPGDGEGHFGPVVDFGAPTVLYSPFLAVDLDGDGRADFVSVRGGDEDSLVVEWNLGNSFSAPVLFDFGTSRFGEQWTGPADLKAGDFNGDGLADLALVKGTGGGGSDGVVAIILNHGHRTFGAPSPSQFAGEDANQAAVGDFDGDGSDEIAVAAMATDYDGRYTVFKADGSELRAMPDISRDGGYAVEHFATCIAAGDFNGDGRPDLAIGCGYTYGGRSGAIVIAPNITPLTAVAHERKETRLDGQTSTSPAATFEIEGVRPNPAVGGRINVSFALPSTAPARIEVIDIAGRRVAEREVGSLGSGRHVVEIAGGRHLAPGIYLVRLTQGTSVRTARVAILD